MGVIQIIATSFFSRYNGPKGVSIVLYSPRYWNGQEYKRLAPPLSLFNAYIRKEIDESGYTNNYIELVLKKLDPYKVFMDLDNHILLGNVGYNKFCHRHIVAKWLEDALNLSIYEL